MLNILAKKVHSTARFKGFWDKPRDPAEVLMLVNSELVEAYEHYRKTLELNVHHYEADGKPFGVPSEIADAIIRLLDISAAWDIDIELAISEKMRYNETRPHKHGKEF